MDLAIYSIAILAISSLFSALTKNETRRAALACFGTAIASAVGLMSKNGSVAFSTNIPHVTFSFGIDPLSRFFLIVIFGISFLTSFYGFGYIKSQKKLSSTVPFFPLLVAAMAGVVMSRDALSFLILWEVMSLVSFFLVTSEHESKDVQNAGWIYLIATHLACAFLMAFFVIMANKSGSFMFSDFAQYRAYSPVLASTLFLFAVVGFGTKAGIFPFHIWLPHAHPAAPSYISAIMSGVMIKTGIYGILRTLTFLGTPPLWWGGLLITIGILSAVIGVLYAIMQHDLKRLLAYHSVENIGIIVTGIGLGMIGITKGNMLIAGLGFTGAIFHILNHAIFKSLLFLCAGVVAHSTHTLAIDRLGGLIKKLPVTGALFLIAAMSICGLPPFNGFISEWLIYVGLFSSPILLSSAGIIGIAFAGGLAVLCFTKVFGVVFLGEPRSEMPVNCVEPTWLFIAPMAILAVLCISIGLIPNAVYPIILSAAENISANLQTSRLDTAMSSLNLISIVFAMLIILALSLLLLRKIAFRKKEVHETVTWDCGYAYPKATMQYTAGSFAEPIGTFFAPLLRPSVSTEKISGMFPNRIEFLEHVHDCAESRFFQPVFRGIGSALMFIRKRKKSTVQSYLMLIFITVIVLFVLEVWFGI